jgi:hypothetical protein
MNLRQPLMAAGVVSVLLAAGLAVAQVPGAPEAVVPGPPPEAPPAGVVEEAPPPVTVAPPPVAPPPPPVQAKDVAPAVPPKATVAEKPAEALKRSRSNVAILQALDKVTAESIRFEAEVGKPVRYKTLIFTVKACERAAPDEAMDDSIVYVTVDSQPRPSPGKPAPPPRQAFKGWMYASSPGLNPLEHPVYDAWLITCKAPPPAPAPPPGAASPKAAAPKRAPAAPSPPPAPKV